MKKRMECTQGRSTPFTFGYRSYSLAQALGGWFGLEMAPVWRDSNSTPNTGPRSDFRNTSWTVTRITRYHWPLATGHSCRCRVCRRLDGEVDGWSTRFKWMGSELWNRWARGGTVVVSSARNLGSAIEARSLSRSWLLNVKRLNASHLCTCVVARLSLSFYRPQCSAGTLGLVLVLLNLWGFDSFEGGVEDSRAFKGGRRWSLRLESSIEHLASIMEYFV